MREATFTELRNHAKDYFDAVEGGDTVRVFRNSKAIAEIVPVRSGVPSWKRQAAPLICIDPSRVQRIIRHFIVQCVGSRTDSIATVDQSDIRGLVTA